MIYLLYGDNLYLKKKKIDQLLNQVDINSVNSFTYPQVNFADIFELSNMNNLFSKKQAIMINNCSFFDNEKIDETIFIENFANMNPNTILIFTYDGIKIDNRKKIVKSLKKHGKEVPCFHQKNIFLEVKEMFQGVQINDDNIKYFLEVVGSNLGIIEQEINKLKIYKKEILKEDIDKVCSKFQTPDVFLLVDAIINENIPKTLKLYNIMMKYSEEPTKIIVLCANHFRLIFQTKKLMEMGYSITDIAKKLAVHPYRVKLASEKAYHYDENIILKRLNKLADLDINIKSGLIEKNTGFELFLLGLQ